MFQFQTDARCNPQPASGRRSVLRALAAVFVLIAIGATPLAAGVRAQPTTPTQPILTQSEIIRNWTIAGGFVYWYESCRPFLDETEAFLRRRPVNAGGVQTLVDIDDEDTCETLVGAGVDGSGFYYYNRAAGTLEAIYTNTPGDPPAVLATVGEFTDIGFGDAISRLFLDDEYVYWIEVDARGEFVPDLIKIHRVHKQGGQPETLLTYEGYFAGRGMAITEDGIFWTDSEGLQRIPRPPCGGPCVKTTVHEATLRSGVIFANEAGHLFWWDTNPFAGDDTQIFHTRCPNGSCQTDPRYTAPDLTNITALVANTTHIYWLERITSVGNRIRRLPVGGGTAQTLLEENLSSQGLAIDDQGVYYTTTNLEQIRRLPLDAQAIVRQISFGGWEVTQAIQNLANDVPLLAGKPTFVRVYAALDSGVPIAGVQALLYGERDGAPLPGSPLRPINGNLAVASANALADRADFDGGWLFQLPTAWTQEGDAAIPLENASLTLRVDLDPNGYTGDTTPANNSAEGDFTFTAKAPTCINLRSVWTEARYQSPWDISVGSVIELAESVHPTVRLLAFPEYNQLEEIDWCWKGPIYGPFCSTPYELDDDDSGLLTKMGVLDYFHSSPSICFQTGARTLYAGIVSAETTWSWAGLARRGKDQSLSKVPRYGSWSGNLERTDGGAMTFVHEIGHNYDRKHIDCGNPKNPDGNYPYATDMLDDKALDAPSTYFGFDSRFLKPIAPDTNADYMSYCGPRWISDYTWRAIFANTRQAGPRFPFAAAGAESPAQDVYILASGLITPALPGGELTSIWRYPTAEAGENLLLKWQAAAAAPWDGEPYHLRVLGENGAVLADWAVELVEVEDRAQEIYPFHVIFPEPATPVETLQLLDGETVLASFSPDAAAPQVTIVAPAGGELVTDTLTLQWTAVDPDGAPWLLYTVQYSPDQGETWYALLADRPGPGQGVTESLVLDLRGEPGSEGATALLRVVASDGYHTGMATSAPFSVAPRAPDVLITAPSAGQWFAAGDPVRLAGDAFAPDEGVLADDAFRWQLPGLEVNGRTAVAAGLAPGVYTPTLQATGAGGLQGSAQVTFQVAPLAVPLAAARPALDGKCDDVAYAASLPLAPYADGAAAHAAVVRSADALWICLQGLQGESGYAGLYVDVDNSQESTVQAGDLGFFVQSNGTPMALEGTAGGFDAVLPSGMAAHVSGDAGGWSAELRIDAARFGGWNRRVALAVGHYGVAEPVAWPHTATAESPQSWAQTHLGEGETPLLSAVEPISTVVGSSVTLTLTGSGFAEGTVVLWNGEPVTTTFVDAGTLQAAVGAERIAAAGVYTVQVAPGAAPLLASTPLPFLALYGAPVVGALSPAAATVGGDGFTLTVDGAGFVAGAVVLWNGEARPTRLISSTRLEADIAADDLAEARAVPVTVANPDPSLGIAATRFTVRPAGEIFLPAVHQ